VLTSHLLFKSLGFGPVSRWFLCRPFCSSRSFMSNFLNPILWLILRLQAGRWSPPQVFDRLVYRFFLLFPPNQFSPPCGAVSFFPPSGPFPNKRPARKTIRPRVRSVRHVDVSGFWFGGLFGTRMIVWIPPRFFRNWSLAVKRISPLKPFRESSLGCCQVFWPFFEVLQTPTSIIFFLFFFRLPFLSFLF